MYVQTLCGVVQNVIRCTYSACVLICYVNVYKMDLPVSFSLAGVLTSISEGVQKWYHDPQF